MIIKNLRLYNFRNYKKEIINLSPSTNILIGNNAAGKTNILESIYCLALARSYKAKDNDIILNGESFYKICSNIEFVNKTDELILIGTQDGKKILINNVEIKKVSEFVGKLNVVLFSPDDILILKNGPQEKRKLLDLSLLQLSKQYIDNYTAFKKHLKLRNDYLKYLIAKIDQKEEFKDEMLDVLTSNFVEYNKRIYESRNSFVDELQKEAEKKYKLLSGEEARIEIKYETNFENNIDFYQKRYKQDIFNGTTQNGCHRDDLKFLKNGQNIESTCSQGEMRMFMLSLKLALADILKKTNGDSPVVLLDDVLSELDKNHQNRLLKMIDKSMQIIITSTDILKIEKNALENAKIYTINQGTIKEIQLNG